SSRSLVSFGTRLSAVDSKATYRPSALIAGDPLYAFPGWPVGETLTLSTFTLPAAPATPASSDSASPRPDQHRTCPFPLMSHRFNTRHMNMPAAPSAMPTKPSTPKADSDL